MKRQNTKYNDHQTVVQTTTQFPVSSAIITLLSLLLLIRI